MFIQQERQSPSSSEFTSENDSDTESEPLAPMVTGCSAGFCGASCRRLLLTSASFHDDGVLFDSICFDVFDFGTSVAYCSY